MFDKLIVSEPDRTAIKDRRSYFMVSSVVVGILFITAVVISIYAEDFGIGNGGIELTEMLAPVDMAVSAPEPPQALRNQRHSTSQLPTRQVNMQDLAETPRVPDTISTAPNTTMARPLDSRFEIGPTNTNPTVISGSNGSRDTSGAGQNTSGLTNSDTVAEPDTTPPPAIKKVPPVVSKGVINGIAKALPKPEYSAAARAIRASGKVDVQVTIDEEGNVVSAHAVSGHPMLRSAAETAARRAKFSQTKLSDVPVKVTGVIVYNFIS